MHRKQKTNTKQNKCLYKNSIFINRILISIHFHSLIHLFEAGILEKMTNAEYEKMFKSKQVENSDKKTVDKQGTSQNV